ncbi:ADP-ribosylglycohydrolase [Hesseltinella vesiculosa]|uniref:ADP-ribosylglycohydrolase n=1 Tax=Hesseltinella vesiculosa TaxID=101127 RepID=A0A1X2G974_9FUNG|nr:ADP-ribosylglycohydrolase [Hesseltinella vesiculosa]
MRVPSGCSKYEKTVIIDKVKGLIFGAVIGDSLGLATEGMTHEEVARIYGNGPIRFGMEDKGVPFHRDSYRACFDENDFGGDAEQQLLLMQAIMDDGGVFHYKEYAKLLLAYSKEGLPGQDKKPIGLNKTSQTVIAHPDYAQNPCKAAVDVWQTTNTLRGANGALVRAAIIGIPKFWDGTTVIENTADCCRITHPDPRCMISCVIVSTLVSRILRGQDLEKDDDDRLHLIAPTLPPTPTTDAQPVVNPTALRGHDLATNPTPPPTSPRPVPPSAKNNNIPLSSSQSLPADPTMQAIVQNVIETNKRILTDPNTDPLFMTPETNISQTQLYYQELLDYCQFSHSPSAPVDFASLQLDHVKSSRHTFKCLGAGILAFTRAIPPGQETEAFKTILMDLVLQGGEADTNATVAAALLGLRIGYSHLPSEWVVGLKRWEWLEDLVEEFCNLL